MTQDKELLLKDLCARLPYSVKVESVFINPDTKEHKPCGIEIFDATSLLMIRDGLGEFKPYLFPLSSMTKEQKIRCQAIQDMGASYSHRLIDRYNEWYLDYRGLIEKGLAIDATELNVY